MVKIESLNKKCKKVTSTDMSTIYIRPKKQVKEFYKEVYASIQKSDGKYVVDTIDNGKGHYLGFSKKKMEPGRYSKSVALKKAVTWMKQKGVC